MFHLFLETLARLLGPFPRLQLVLELHHFDLKKTDYFLHVEKNVNLHDVAIEHVEETKRLGILITILLK